MDWWLASFFLGSILSLFLPIVPELFVLILLILFSIILFLYKPLRLSSGLFFGASWMLYNAFNYQNLWQDNNLDLLELAQTSQWVEGKVISLQHLTTPDQFNDSKKTLRFNFNITHLNSEKITKPLKIRLSWKNADITVQQGQFVRLKVKFKPAHGLANIGGFSYQTWLRSKHITATGYVIKDKNNKVLTTSYSIRQQLFNSYKNLLPEHDLSPLLLALGFGSRGELNQSLWQVLQATGTGHLIAISGLHIGLVVTGSYFLVLMLIRLLPLSSYNNLPFFQTLNIRYFAILISLAVGIAYGYLAGFSLPTIRALLMLSLYWLSRILSVNISIKRWLLLTLFLLTIMTPFSLFTASFWLSVYAVTIIFLTLWRFQSVLNSGHTAWRFIKGLFVIQLSLTVMLLPISAVFFQQISFVALLANLVAVPWMSFFSIPLCLLSVLVMPLSESLSQSFMVLCIETLQVLWQYLSYLSHQSWALVRLSSDKIQLAVLFGLVSTIFLFLRSPRMITSGVSVNRRGRKKLLVLLNISILLFFILNTINFNHLSRNNKKQKSDNALEWQVIVFDVGQGLSVLIKRGANAILYDTGAAYPSGFSMADAVILPYLQHSNLAQIDKVIISHSDNDHSGGLLEIEKSIKVSELFYNDRNAKNKLTKNSICSQGKSFSWQNLEVEMLWPKDKVSDENDDSCVVIISDGKYSVLLTGDISNKVELALINQYSKLTTDILIVPHHGSKTSSSNLFISTLKPAFAVVSAGYLNRWHMPVAEVVRRYQQHNIELLNTASLGQIIFTISEEGIRQQSYNRDLWPFWFAH